MNERRVRQRSPKWAAGGLFMTTLSRRAFLGASLAGLASDKLLRADEPSATAKKTKDDAPFQPSTLFLTWQRDPTTTMTIQWIGTPGETADTDVSYAALPDGDWQ